MKAFDYCFDSSVDEGFKEAKLLKICAPINIGEIFIVCFSNRRHLNTTCLAKH